MVLCSCVLILFHALICVFISGLRWLVPPSRAGLQIRGSVFLLVAPWLVLPPSRAECKYGLSLVGLQGSGSLLPDACRRAQVRLLPAAFRQRWLRDCPDVRCWWWGCQCVHLLLRGWHRHERCHRSGGSSTSSDALRIRGSFSSSASRRVSLAWSFLPRCSVPAPWVRRGVVLCAGGLDVFVVVERSLRFLAPDRALASCVVFVMVLGSAAVLGGV